MHRPARYLLLATLAVGTAVFGVTLTVLARSGPLDPRAALAGILAAAALTAALLALAWARRRTAGGAGSLARSTFNGAADKPQRTLQVVPLGNGQAAVVFDEPPTGRPVPYAPPAAPAADPAAEADAIWAAVQAVTAAPAGDHPRPSLGGLAGRLDRLRGRRRPPASGRDSR